jgi:hypothetical protein
VSDRRCEFAGERIIRDIALSCFKHLPGYPRDLHWEARIISGIGSRADGVLLSGQHHGLTEAWQSLKASPGPTPNERCREACSDRRLFANLLTHPYFPSALSPGSSSSSEEVPTNPGLRKTGMSMTYQYYSPRCRYAA